MMDLGIGPVAPVEATLTPGVRWRSVRLDIQKQAILGDVTLEVLPGEVLSLVGPSGCGKTTLLSLAGGLSMPTSGVVENGFRRTAYMFQESRLLPWRTAADNAAFGLRAQGVPRKDRRAAARDLLRRLGLGDEHHGKYPHELSGGMRQRVALARALAVEPDLLLLDEPFSALDVGLRRDLQDLVLDAVRERGLTVIFVTHDLAEAARISHRIAVMAGAPGRIVHLHDLEAVTGYHQDDARVAAEVSRLLAEPAVAEAFSGGRFR